MCEQITNHKSQITNHKNRKHNKNDYIKYWFNIIIPVPIMDIEIRQKNELILNHLKTLLDPNVLQQQANPLHANQLQTQQLLNLDLAHLDRYDPQKLWELACFLMDVVAIHMSKLKLNDYPNLSDNQKQIVGNELRFFYFCHYFPYLFFSEKAGIFSPFSRMIVHWKEFTKKNDSPAYLVSEEEVVQRQHDANAMKQLYDSILNHQVTVHALNSVVKHVVFPTKKMTRKFLDRASKAANMVRRKRRTQKKARSQPQPQPQPQPQENIILKEGIVTFAPNGFRLNKPYIP